MSTHSATIRWKNTGPDFLNRMYSREHTVHFDGGAVMPGSPSPQIVHSPWSNPASVDPEECFVAAVASCHMLWFLHVVIDAGYVADSYQDEAEGVMTRNDRGLLWISQIILRPQVVWSGSTPAVDEQRHLHHLAHEQCFIANSIKTEVRIDHP
jgi:organic hydroperoxide reductase OsmC/OhrA